MESPRQMPEAIDSPSIVSNSNGNRNPIAEVTVDLYTITESGTVIEPITFYIIPKKRPKRLSMDWIARQKEISDMSWPVDDTITRPKPRNVQQLWGLSLLVGATMGSAVIWLWDIARRMKTDDRIYREQRLYLKRTLSPETYETLTRALSSPNILAAAVTITVACLTIYPYLHIHEIYQTALLMEWIALGIVMGRMYGADNIAILLRIIPRYAILGLFLSTVFSNLFLQRGGPTIATGGRGRGGEKA